MKKIAVFFPGVSYSCEKPLLYYTASAAHDHGYQIIKLDYGHDIHSSRGRSPHELEQLTKLALKRVIPRILELNLNQYDDVIFVSKSIGTTIALETELCLKPLRPIRHFLLTPLKDTFPYIAKSNGVFFSGTADCYVPADIVRSSARKYADKCGGTFELCNHSLEIEGDTIGNLKRLEQILLCFNWMLEQIQDFPI